MTQTTDILNLLIFDTSDNTTELFVRKLAESGMQLHSQRESDKVRLFDAIKSRHWDMLLLSDEVRELDTSECIACIRQCQRQVALVVLTAKPVGAEELAIAYRDGIAALVSLEYPEYSCAVIAREFHALRHQRLSAQLQFENSELVERCQALMGSSNEAVAYVHDGMHVHANAAYLQKFRFGDIEEALGTPFIDLVHASCRQALKETLQELQKNGRNEANSRKTPRDLLAIDSAGAEFAAQFVFSASQYEGEEVLQVLLNTESAEQARLKQAAHADTETGLYNRQYFLKQADEFIELGRSGKFAGGILLYVVVNRYDSMRTDISWDAADSAMSQLASYLKLHCGSHDILARLTDGAFAMLICAGAGEDAQAACDALLAQLAQFSFGTSGFGDHRDQLAPCTAVSMAIDAQAPSLRECLTRLMQRAASRQNADALASVAQTSGLLHTAVASSTEEYMAGCLGLALSGNQARLFHYPVISVGEIETEFHDIELRIQGLEGELLGHQQWQRYIDHHDHGLRADRWQLETALTLLSRLQYQHQAPQFMFTLTSATLTDAGFEPWLATLVGDCDLMPTAVILNVSATQVLRDPANVALQLSSLAGAGFRICISEPFDIEEIGQLVVMTNASFARFNAVSIRHLMSDDHAGTPFSVLVDTLQQSGCRVIVAGADDNRMLSLLWQQKVDLMQGTYFGYDATEVTAEAFYAVEAVVQRDSYRQFKSMGGQ